MFIAELHVIGCLIDIHLYMANIVYVYIYRICVSMCVCVATIKSTVIAAYMAKQKKIPWKTNTNLWKFAFAPASTSSR